MKKLFTFLFFISLAIGGLQAQYELNYGLKLGGANYLGEIGGASEQAQPFLLDMNIQQTNFAVGGFFRYSFSRKVSAKFSANFARIEGADSLSNYPARVGRNLSFRTDLFEATLTGEYNFFQMNDFSRRSRQRIDFNSYVFGGAGALLFYPYGQLEDTWYSLRPLRTEGQEEPYDEITIVVPMGAGFEFTFNNKYRFGLEVGYRFTFTDYLDDISTTYAEPEDLPFIESIVFANRSDEAFARGNADLPDRGHYGNNSIRGDPDNNDGYLMVQFTVSYVIKTGNDFYKPRYNSIINRRRKRTKF